MLDKLTPKSIVKSPLRYPGGKSKAIDRIVEYLPSSFREYREPFVGGGSLFLYLYQSLPELTVWINDLNPELYHFWRQSQIDLDALVAGVREIKHNCDDGRALFDRLSKVNTDELSDLERAIRFFVLNRITFSGTIEAGGYSAQSYRGRFTDSAIQRLAKLDRCLNDVKITNLDYSHLLTRSTEDVLIFLDPPYYSATKSKLYGKQGILHLDFDHQRLAELLIDCPHKWLMTYDDSPQIRELYQFAQISTWELQYGMNNYQRSTAAKGKELFIYNY